MADRVIHVSEAEAAGDFAGIMARVRAGAEVVIENGSLPVAVIHAPVPPHRSISECIALLPEKSTATSMPTSPRMFEQPLKAIAKRSNHPHGIDSRFQCVDHR